MVLKNTIPVCCHEIWGLSQILTRWNKRKARDQTWNLWAWWARSTHYRAIRRTVYSEQLVLTSHKLSTLDNMCMGMINGDLKSWREERRWERDRLLVFHLYWYEVLPPHTTYTMSEWITNMGLPVLDCWDIFEPSSLQVACKAIWL